MAIQKLNKETKEKILSELEQEHKRRYGSKPDGNTGRLLPKRKTYVMKDLEGDLEFILNHLTL
jgi:hypothetical protein